MNYLKITALFLSAFVLLSASCEASKTNEEEQRTEVLPPVETERPNSPDFKPAFEGQTRVAGVKTTTPYEAIVIADGLVKPWAVTTLPDGRLAITEKGGAMRIATTTGNVSSPITGIPEVDDRRAV